MSLIETKSFHWGNLLQLVSIPFLVILQIWIGGIEGLLMIISITLLLLINSLMINEYRLRKYLENKK